MTASFRAVALMAVARPFLQFILLKKSDKCPSFKFPIVFAACLTIGQLLKKTGINRIPVRNINVSDIEISLNTPKNEELDFNAVPFVPQKIAKIISSFANTNGGSLIFGLKEINITTNEIVGLSDVPEVIHSDKYVTDRLLADYLSSSVSAYTKEELGYDQNPKAILDSSNENIISEVEFENVE